MMHSKEKCARGKHANKQTRERQAQALRRNHAVEKVEGQQRSMKGHQATRTVAARTQRAAAVGTCRRPVASDGVTLEGDAGSGSEAGTAVVTLLGGQGGTGEGASQARAARHPSPPLRRLPANCGARRDGRVAASGRVPRRSLPSQPAPQRQRLGQLRGRRGHFQRWCWHGARAAPPSASQGGPLATRSAAVHGGRRTGRHRTSWTTRPHRAVDPCEPSPVHRCDRHGAQARRGLAADHRPRRWTRTGQGGGVARRQRASPLPASGFAPHASRAVARRWMHPPQQRSRWPHRRCGYPGRRQACVAHLSCSCPAWSCPAARRPPLPPPPPPGPVRPPHPKRPRAPRPTAAAPGRLPRR